MYQEVGARDCAFVTSSVTIREISPVACQLLNRPTSIAPILSFGESTVGFLGTLLGVAVGYDLADVRRWQRQFPDGVTRCSFSFGAGSTNEQINVSIIDAIRHVQNSNGWSALNGCALIAGELAAGNCVPTGCGRFYYVHKVSYEERRQREQGTPTA